MTPSREERAIEQAMVGPEPRFMARLAAIRRQIALGRDQTEIGKIVFLLNSIP
jgi:hypothetical protein